MPPKLAYHEEHTTFEVPPTTSFDKAGYDRDITVLETLPIWTKISTGLSLWKNQRHAIALGAAYARLSQPTGRIEAGLIKMPTGSGKSGVIAVLTRCLPDIRRALVLTPREGLVQQMYSDIRRRFWANMGVADDPGEDWTGPGVEQALVRILLPNATRTQQICNEAATHDRVILVSTLQALDKIRTDRDRLVRKEALGPLETDHAARTGPPGAYPEGARNLRSCCGRRGAL